MISPQREAARCTTCWYFSGKPVENDTSISKKPRGESVGAEEDGFGDGMNVGVPVGGSEGLSVGLEVGKEVGEEVGLVCTGEPVGREVGDKVGET